MTKIMEIRDRVIRFVAEYDFYLNPVAKFLLAMLVFTSIKSYIGYFDKVNNPLLLTILALVCCLLPINSVIWFSAILVLVNLYALSKETALVGLLVLVVIYLLYFRFTPKEGVAALLTPIAFRMHIPYVMTIGCGLLRSGYSCLAIAFGTVISYYISGVHHNAPAIREASANADASLSDKIRLALGNVYNNKEMYLVILVLVLTTIAVSMIRRISADHAWTLAIITGTLIQLLGLFAGYMFLNISSETVWLLLGNIIALAVGFGLQFLFMDLDYTRVERVQFEDEDYYYYVKAVPKKIVKPGEKTVQVYSNGESGVTGATSRKVSLPELIEEEKQRRELEEELGIEENSLK